MRRLIQKVLLCAVVGLAGCSQNGDAATTSRAAPLQPAGVVASSPRLQPANAIATAGYSCSFPGPGGRTILARFSIDGQNAHDDEGTTFAVLANSATAVVLARPRDDVSAPNGDVGGYLVAIDRRDLSMVQSTVGVRGEAATRKGRCIAG